jgi:hypothetical protein
MPQNIGTNYSIRVPSLSDSADIQTAFEVFHYGTAGTDATLLELESAENSIAGYLRQLEVNKADLDSPVFTSVINISGGTGKAIIDAPTLASDVTITLPSVSTVLVGKSDTATLTNKTLTTPVIEGGVEATPTVISGWVNFTGTVKFLGDATIDIPTNTLIQEGNLDANSVTNVKIKANEITANKLNATTGQGNKILRTNSAADTVAWVDGYATTSLAGLVKIGTNISVAADGTISLPSTITVNTSGNATTATNASFAGKSVWYNAATTGSPSYVPATDNSTYRRMFVGQMDPALNAANAVVAGDLWFW